MCKHVCRYANSVGVDEPAVGRTLSSYMWFMCVATFLNTVASTRLSVCPSRREKTLTVVVHVMGGGPNEYTFCLK